MLYKYIFCSYNSLENVKQFLNKWLSFTIYTLVIGFAEFIPTNLLAQPLAEGKDKFLGNVLTNTIYSNFGNYWNQVTPGNAGKWSSVEGTQDAYNWTLLDNIYNYALSKGFIYKHHTLIWGQQYPSWITSLDSANQRAQVKEWIQLVGERYPDMDFVDVVNEPFNAPPPYMNALGDSGATGWDWVITAFEWARQYCAPGVKLVLNEYNVLQSNEVTDNYIALIDTLNARGLIDAVGIQGHYFEFKGPGYTYSIGTIKSNLNRIVETGLPVYITEFDIDEADNQTQLDNYKTYFPIFWENPGVKGITLWGYIENDTWKPNAYLIDYTGRQRPALTWLRSYLKSPLRPVLISPIGTSNEPRNPLLIWHRSESATSYHIQISYNSSYSMNVLDTVVTDTLMRSSLLDANRRYYWHASASNEFGESFYSDNGGFMTGEQIVSVDESNKTLSAFYLEQNYPNPFNPTTKITYSIPESGYISLKVYDLLGQEVATLFEGNLQAGKYSVLFDGSNLAGGIYLYCLKSNNSVQTKKLIFLR